MIEAGDTEPPTSTAEAGPSARITRHPYSNHARNHRYQYEYDGERNRKRQPARNLVAAVLDTAARQQEAAARQQERRERPGSPAAAVQRGALRQIMGAAIGPSRAGRHSLCGRTSVSRSSTAVRRYLLCFWWFGFFGVIGYWASPCDQQGT